MASTQHIRRSEHAQHGAAGFSLLEMPIALVILPVGLPATVSPSSIAGVAAPASTFVLCDSPSAAFACALDLDVSGQARIAATAGFDADGITALSCDPDPNRSRGRTP